MMKLMKQISKWRCWKTSKTTVGDGEAEDPAASKTQTDIQSHSPLLLNDSSEEVEREQTSGDVEVSVPAASILETANSMLRRNGSSLSLKSTSSKNNIQAMLDSYVSNQKGTSGHSSTMTGPKTYIGVSEEQGYRPYMEDRHMIIKDFRPGMETDAEADGMNRCFAAIYDGHCGAKAAEMAKDQLHVIVGEMEAISSHLNAAGQLADAAGGYSSEDASTSSRRSAPNGSNAVEEALKEAFHRMDRAILDQAEKDEEGYGCTAVMVLQAGRRLWVAHAGDSGALLCRGKRTVRLTQDHKPGLPQERTRILAQGGKLNMMQTRVVNGGSALAVSRAFGDISYKQPAPLVAAEPDVACVTLVPGDDSFAIIASDGLFDVFTDRDAIKLVQSTIKDKSKPQKKGAPPLSPTEIAQAAAEALVRKSLSMGTFDNVTAAVLLFDWGEA